MLISPVVSLGSAFMELRGELSELSLEFTIALLQVLWKLSGVINALTSIVRLHTDVLWPLDCCVSIKTSTSGGILVFHLLSVQTPKIYLVVRIRWIGKLWILAVLKVVLPHSSDPEFAEASRYRSTFFKEIEDVRKYWLWVAQVMGLGVFVFLEPGWQFD